MCCSLSVASMFGSEATECAYLSGFASDKGHEIFHPLCNSKWLSYYSLHVSASVSLVPYCKSRSPTDMPTQQALVQLGEHRTRKRVRTAQDTCSISIFETRKIIVRARLPGCQETSTIWSSQRACIYEVHRGLAGWSLLPAREAQGFGTSERASGQAGGRCRQAEELEGAEWGIPTGSQADWTVAPPVQGPGMGGCGWMDGDVSLVSGR